MKACIFQGPGRVEVESRPVPSPGPGELVLRMQAAGICHSDIRVYKGEKYARPGVVPGHEMVGTVEATGQGVSGISVGQRVAVCPIIACGRCYYCQRGLRNRCLQRVTLGYEEDGGLAEFALIPASIVALGHVFPVPEGLPSSVATLMEPTACVLNSLEVCRLQPGGSLVLLGSGPMGLLHLLLARAMGVATIVVSELVAERREYAQQFGASLVLDPQREDIKAAVLEVTAGLGADAVVVTTGAAALLKPALAVVRRQGVINLFAGFPPNTTVDFDPNTVHYSEVILTGSQNATPDQYRRALHLLAEVPQAAKLNTHAFPVDQGPKAYEARLGMSGLKSLVVFPGAEPAQP